MIPWTDTDWELECPGCNADQLSERRNGCEDPWHDGPFGDSAENGPAVSWA